MNNPKEDREDLGSLIDQGFQQLRRYDNAVERADDDAAGMSRLVEETNKWLELQKRIDQLRIETSNLSSTLEIKIRTFDDAVKSSNEKTRLVVMGQRREAEASLSLTIQKAHQLAEFSAKWLKEKERTVSTLTAQEKVEYLAARIRWIEEFELNQSTENDRRA